MPHKHKWKYAFSQKAKGVTKYVHLCEDCRERKEETSPPYSDRLSNMGGEFSTNWRP